MLKDTAVFIQIGITYRVHILNHHIILSSKITLVYVCDGSTEQKQDFSDMNERGKNIDNKAVEAEPAHCTSKILPCAITLLSGKICLGGS